MADWVQFRYFTAGSSVEVRHHRTCCSSSKCECTPPAGSSDYECSAAGSLPDDWPPVCPERMAHLLFSPGCVTEGSTFNFDKVPKKLDCRLRERTDGEPSPGWGLYFQEDLDISAMIGVVFLILFLASLLFLILWTILKDDVQGASGVSAYIAAVASMGGIWIATKSRSFE